MIYLLPGRLNEVDYGFPLHCGESGFAPVSFLLELVSRPVDLQRQQVPGQGGVEVRVVHLRVRRAASSVESKHVALAVDNFPHLICEMARVPVEQHNDTLR